MHLAKVLFFVTHVFVSIQVFGQNPSVYTYELAQKGNPYEVYHLSMVKYLSEKKTLPKEILRYKNLKELDLSAPVTKIVKGKAYFGESKLKSLPDWLKEFEKLEKIEIRGNTGINYEKELLFLVEIKALQSLTISPAEVTYELIEVLCKFNNLKELNIEYQFLENDKRLERLKTCLMDCSINLIE